MHLLVTYDVSTVDASGRRRLRQVAKTCLDYGQRVQKSVFECNLDYATFIDLRTRLLDIADLATDSIRFYNLGSEWDRRVEHYGVGGTLDPTGPLIV